MRWQLMKNRLTVLRMVAIGVFGIIPLLFTLRYLPATPVRILPCADCNIVFVSFDTLRASNIHTLGYRKNTTPTIDEISRKGVSFTNAVSVAPWTLPSTMSWFTSLYPSEHRVTNKVTILESGEEKNTSLQLVSKGTRTLADVLLSNGWRTGGFTGGAGVDHSFGFNQGFEEYSDAANFGGFNQSAPKALAWISAHKNEKLFVFLHGYDIHGQYVPPGGYDKRFVDFAYTGTLTGSADEQKKLREEGITTGHIFLSPQDVKFLVALYDEKIQRADAEFKKFLDSYDALGITRKTIFILTSDHGEEFYEHGQIDHGHSVYDELIHVPLFMQIPGLSRGVRIETQVRSIDILPTILDLVQIPKQDPIWKQAHGQSLIGIITGASDSKLDVFPETDYRFAVSLRAAKTWNNWKIILNREYGTKEIYNLSKSPDEKINLLDATSAGNSDMINTLNSVLLSQLSKYSDNGGKQ